MKISIHRGCIASLMLCALASASAEARAKDASPHSVAVSIAGIDLETDQGRRIVFRRLKNAAKIVCSDLAAPHSLTRIVLYKKCVDGALTEAVRKVNHAAFLGYARGRLGDRQPEIVTAAR